MFGKSRQLLRDTSATSRLWRSRAPPNHEQSTQKRKYTSRLEKKVLKENGGCNILDENNFSYNANLYLLKYSNNADFDTPKHFFFFFFRIWA